MGSFIATATARWGAGRTMGGRSRCDGCGRTLTALELVPLFSGLFLRGKCRSCGTRIGWRQPAAEALCAVWTAVLAVLLPWPAALAGAVFGWLLMALAVIDLEQRRLPHALTLSLGLAGLATALWMPAPPMLDRLIGGSLGWASLALIRILYRHIRGKEGMGGGDPIMLGALGLWLGWSPIPVLVLAASGLGLAAFFVWMRHHGTTSRLPFGTLLALAGAPLWLELNMANGLSFVTL